MSALRRLSTMPEQEISAWKRIKFQSRLLKPALLLVLFGSAAVNYNRDKKSLEDLHTKFDKKISILEEIRTKLRAGDEVDLAQELKLINKSFEFANLGGSYFKGFLEKPHVTEQDDFSDILSHITGEDTPAQKPALQQQAPAPVREMKVEKKVQQTVSSRDDKSKLTEFL